MTNHRKKVFVQEYLVSGNATQAALKAGYSPKTARSQGQRLLTNVDIQTAIKNFQNKMEEKTTVTLERVVLELTKVAFSDIGEVMDVEDNNLRIKNLSELSSDVRAAIAEITETDTAFGKRRSIKLHSKLTALDMLMKHLGGYVTVQDLIDRLDEETLEKLTKKLLSQMKPKTLP
jgi:phage terminase small subunit